MGLPVEVVHEGSPVELTAGIDLSAYRIVQEALTNALKHAGPPRARVRVSHTTDHLDLEVVEDGPGTGTGGGSGHGRSGSGNAPSCTAVTWRPAAAPRAATPYVPAFVEADWPLIGGSFTNLGVDALWLKRLCEAQRGRPARVRDRCRDPRTPRVVPALSLVRQAWLLALK